MPISPYVEIKLEKADPTSTEGTWEFTEPTGISGKGSGPVSSQDTLTSGCFGSPSQRCKATPIAPKTWGDPSLTGGDIDWVMEACE